jgi:hypothetical protein
MAISYPSLTKRALDAAMAQEGLNHARIIQPRAMIDKSGWRWPKDLHTERLFPGRALWFAFKMATQYCSIVFCAKSSACWVLFNWDFSLFNHLSP